MRPKSSFFTELKRRNVIRMAGLYLVGAWLLTQVASTVLPTFEVPSSALRGMIITLSLGFVPALISSWVFELTPQGLKRDAEVAPSNRIAPQTARRMDRVLLLALGYFGFDKFVLAPRREAALIATTAQSRTAALPNEISSTADYNESIGRPSASKAHNRSALITPLSPPFSISPSAATR